MKIPPLQGRTLHERLFDPAQFRFSLKKDFNARSKESFSGFTPDIFVGRFGYPSVRVGLLSSPLDASTENPLQWSKQGSGIPHILKSRMSLVDAGSHAHVKLPSGSQGERLKELGRQAAMAVKALDTDVSLSQKPSFRLNLNDTGMPRGPRAELKSLTVTSNPKIPKQIDSVVDDADLKAGAGIHRLWTKGFAEHQLSSLLSSGSVGTRLERRLVPTRWGITAVDDVVGKSLHRSIMEFDELDFRLYVGGHLGNVFVLLFFPSTWGFELFENYAGDQQLSTEYHDVEGFRGRSSYAQHTAGGYYAARLPVLEFLQSSRRKASVLALRFITPEYWAPLGVWVVREAVRKALASEPIVCSSEEELLKSAAHAISSRFGLDPSVLFQASELLRQRRSQTTLGQFS